MSECVRRVKRLPRPLAPRLGRLDIELTETVGQAGSLPHGRSGSVVELLRQVCHPSLDAPGGMV
jgi:hypothetical protein